METSVKKTILLVEDEMITAMLNKQALEKYGYTVTTVNTGEKAVETIQNTSGIDLILMDIDLGKGIDGTQAAEIILSKRDIPVVFLSSHTEPEVVEKTEKITSYGYVVKNSSITVLDASIKMAFKLFDTKQNEQKKEDELRESRDYLESLFDYSNVPIIVWDSKFQITRFNHAAETLTGRVMSDVIGKQVEVLFHPGEAEGSMKYLQKTITGEKLKVREINVLHSDGSIRTLLWNSATIFQNDGKTVIGTIAQGQDITERKLSENALRASRDSAEMLLNVAAGIIISLDEKGNITLLNESGHTILGYESPELIGKNWFATCLPDENRMEVSQYFQKLQHGYDAQIIITHENEVITKTGERKIILWHNAVLKDKDGAFAGLFSSGEDITERKKTEILLEKEEKRLQNVLNGTNAGTWEWNLQTGEDIIDKTSAALLGYTLDELQPQIFETWMQLKQPDDMKESTNLLLKHVRGETDFYSFESRMKHKNGNWVWIHGRGKVIEWDNEGKPLRMYGTHIDISERKKADDSLRESERKFRIIADSGQALIWMSGTDKLCSYFNKIWLDFTGRTLEQESGNGWTEGVHPEDLQKCIDIYESAFNRHEKFSMEYRLRRYDGEYRWILDDGCPQFDNNCEFAGYIGHCLDITDLKKNEQDLWEYGELYRTIINSSPDTIAITNIEGKILMVSPKALLMFGYDEDELLNHFLTDFIAPEDRDRASINIEQMFIGFIPKLSEYIGIRKDKSSFILEANREYICDSGGEPIQIVFTLRDITERRVAEDKIKSLLAEKELILKEVHHRIKNNMSTIKGLLALQAETLTEPTAIDALEEAGNRVQSMEILYDKLYQAADFMELSLPDYLVPLIDEVVSNFPNSASVKIEKQIDDFVLEVKKLQPLGIIVNELLTNIMKYAFVGRSDGVITVTATLRENLVTLIIADNGNGMSESVSFEKSTGFGLILVKELTIQLGGKIRIERGEGTRFVLDFGRQA